MGHPKQIAKEAGNIGWQRILITTVIGTLITVTLDHFGMINKIARFIPGDW
jgi:hypothetical protein